MSENEFGSFDPYRVWLGIPPEQQPPHHYRLLGIEPFESDPDVIDAAAMRQMGYLRQVATGPYREASQKLLNEIAAARRCLLDAARKAAYDAQLKAQLPQPSKTPLADSAAPSRTAQRADTPRRKPVQPQRRPTLGPPPPPPPDPLDTLPLDDPWADTEELAAHATPPPPPPAPRVRGGLLSWRNVCIACAAGLLLGLLLALPLLLRRGGSAATPVSRDKPPTTDSAAAGQPATPAAAHEPPSILLIVADDLGCGDLKCYSRPRTEWATGADQLAGQALRLTNAHSPYPYDALARYCLLTGRLVPASRVRQMTRGNPPWYTLKEDELTLASLLNQHGYATAFVGAWHLGFQSPNGGDSSSSSSRGPGRKKKQRQQIDYNLPLLPGPRTAGFDYFFGIAGPLDKSGKRFLENDHARTEQPNDWPQCVPDKLLAKATEWLGERSAERPFFLCVSLTLPGSLKEQSASQQESREARVRKFNQVVSQLISKVDSLETADNTLIILTSDTGAAAEEKYADGHRANAPWRGGKEQIWEGGHRVPMIIRWSGHVPEASPCDHLVCLTDLLATFAALVDHKLNANQTQDSFNILPLLRGGPPPQRMRKHLVVRCADGSAAVHAGTWKLVVPMVGGGKKKRRGKPELYNLDEDPSEQKNVARQQPSQVRQLQQLLTKGTNPTNPKKPATPAGKRR